MLAFLQLKGLRHVAAQLCLPVAHRADESDAAGLQMRTEKAVKALPVRVKHQHVDDGHGEHHVIARGMFVPQAVQHLKACGVFRHRAAAEVDRLRRRVRCAQVVALLQQGAGVPALAAADLQQRGALRAVARRHIRHDGRGLLPCPAQALFMDRAVALLIRFIIRSHSLSSLITLQASISFSIVQAALAGLVEGKTVASMCSVFS